MSDTRPRRMLLMLVPFLTLPLIWLMTEGTPAIKPIPWVGAASAVALLLATWGTGERPRWFDYLLVPALGVAATHLLLQPGFPRGHDIVTHLWGVYGFHQSLLAGNFFPRWLHHLGLGMPFLLFYPPLPFYAMTPFMALDLPPYDTLKYGLILFNALSGLSMFIVVSRWTGSRRAALVAAGAYCFAPYHLLESNYRIAIAEAAALAVLPLFVHSMAEALERPDRRHWGKAAFWTAVLAMTHPLSLSMGGIGMALYSLGRNRFSLTKPTFRQLGLLLALGTTGAALAGYYTVPVVAEGQYTTIGKALGRSSHPTYMDHGLYPQQLVERRAWTKWQKSESRGSKKSGDEMPFYFGITLLVLLPLATSSRHREVARGLQVMALGTLALSLYPLDVAFGFFPPMTMLQFSWRFLAIATMAAAALTGFAVLRLTELSPHPWVARLLPGAVFALLVLDFYPYGGAPLWAKPYAQRFSLHAKGEILNTRPLRVDHLRFPPADSSLDVSNIRRVYPEYFTPEVRRSVYRAKKVEALASVGVALSYDKRPRRPKVLKPAPYAALTPVGGGPVEGLEFSRGGEEIVVQLPGRAGRLVIKEQWFPGWEARIGTGHIEVEKTKQGLMAVDLEAVDDGELRLFFSRTRWDRSLGLVLSVLVALGLYLPRGRKGGDAGNDRGIG